MKTYKIFWLGLAAAVALTASLRGATVTAVLDPAQISLGDSTQLTVTVSGSQEQPSVPNVDGLVIQSVSQGTQISIVNGSMTSSAMQLLPQCLAWSLICCHSLSLTRTFLTSQNAIGCRQRGQ